MVLGNNVNSTFTLTIGDLFKKSSKSVELLGIFFDNNVKSIVRNYAKMSYKPMALKRIGKYSLVKQAEILANFFINSQFNCPLIWMFNSKTNVFEIENLHETNGLLRDHNISSFHNIH